MIRCVALLAAILIVPSLAQQPPQPSSTFAPNVKSSAGLRVLDFVNKGDAKGALAEAQKAAKTGESEAHWLIGRMFEQGYGTEVSLPKAAEAYRVAAEQQMPDAMADYARFLRFGFGGEKDPEKARFFDQSAAELGVPVSQVRLAQAAENADGQPQDFAAARSWYEKAAAQNDAEALMALGRFYDTGKGGIEIDRVKATEFYFKAARLGNTLAMNQVGLRYQHGIGMVSDAVAAVGWFSLAAQFGLPEAQVNLGRCYENASGAKQDYDLAGRHYAAAAKQSFPAGQFHLAGLFERGLGTAVNFVGAYVNYARAAKSGYPGADKKRGELERRLNAEQLAEAKKLLGGS
jgi:hypothetical protein